MKKKKKKKNKARVKAKEVKVKQFVFLSKYYVTFKKTTKLNHNHLCQLLGKYLFVVSTPMFAINAGVSYEDQNKK